MTTPITIEADARAFIGEDFEKPQWREGRPALPFDELSDDAFEVFCFLLLKREHPVDDIRLYGGTGDGGRDIVHFRATQDGTVVRLIQCKRYETNVGIDILREDMAKIWVNVFNGTITDRPHELVFCAVPNLTNPAKNLLESQARWRGEAKAAIGKHLAGPVSDELAHHAATWWPRTSVEAALSLTERSRRQPELLEEFFGVRKVVDGGVDDVADEVCARLLPPVSELGVRLERVERTVSATVPQPIDLDALRAACAAASAGLLHWPTTIADGRWLDRPELGELTNRIHSETSTSSVVLGPPGAGKSALLARLGRQLCGGGVTLLAIKADYLPNTVDSPARLAEFLGLPMLVDQAVSALAAVGERVVVLLDQLDALAELADLRSERLHVLLDLISRLAGQPRVHVVCSSREFEFRYDGRLSRIDASEIRLRPPVWEQIAELLASRGVATDGWPEDAKELLRTPQHLVLFLQRLREPGEQPVYTTLQRLLNDTWENLVIRPGGGRQQLVLDLAGRLADAEELWIDRSCFEERWSIVTSLVAAGVLSLSQDEFRLGFRHQSLFEFVQAKGFSRDGESLAVHVLDRQDGLFVRPTLWMALNYLRHADPAVYAREFDRLWNTANLRRHVKHLLVDFLAQVEQPPPTEWERARMVAALHDPSWRRKVLFAVTGRMTWFRILAGSHLPAEMRLPQEQARDVVWVLVAAWTTDRDLCLRLLEQQWLRVESQLQLVWETIRHFNVWDDRATELAIAVVRRTPIGHGAMWMLALTIAATAPLLAIRLLAAWLNAALARTATTAQTDLNPEDAWGDPTDRQVHWFDIEKLSAAAPVDFVRAVWPSVRDRRTVSDRTERTYEYAGDNMWTPRLDARELDFHEPSDEFYQALDAAVRTFAQTQPLEFIAFARDVGNPDSRLLQRLLCRGMREMTETQPHVALGFLMADRRRFRLGGRHDSQCDTIDIVRALAPQLSAEQIDGLVSAIRDWEPYRDGERYDHESERTRGLRYRLLEAISPERLPEDVRRFMATEATELPEYVRTVRPISRGMMTMIASPVPLDEMEGLTDMAVAALFDELNDSTGERHPRNLMQGGSYQLSDVLQEFAKKHPKRAFEVVDILRPGDQERPAASIVRGLVDGGMELAQVIALVDRLDGRGFTGEEFRATVAGAIGNLAGPAGLSESACELLNRWRLAVWADRDSGGLGQERDDTDRQPTSVVWGHGGIVSIPQGRFSVLSALTRGYLLRRPHAADLWLEMLQDHLSRGDTMTNWRAMGHHLVDVRCCTDRAAAGGFLAELFDRYPQMLACQHCARLLAHVAHILPDDARRRAYETVRGGDVRLGLQAFGELVGLRHLWHPEDGWAADRVEETLSVETDNVEGILVGIGFAAANLWLEPRFRDRACGLLCRLVSRPSDRVAHAVMTVYFNRDEFPQDDVTMRLLREVAAHPDVLIRSRVSESFFEHLLDAFATDPDLVGALGEDAVRLRSADLQAAGRGLHMADTALLDISLRLQRSGGDRRRQGMRLFESLLDLGVAEAVNVARSNDLRLAPAIPTYRPRRLRNRRPTD